MHRLLLLGGAFLEGPDGPLTGRAAQGHRLALLALLAAEHPRPLTRDRLMACLWPQSDSERGRRRLRHALHLLRAALGKDALLSHGDELRLDPARLGCDLWEFREALERGALEAGVTAYGGPFLNGVYLDDAEEFERWVEVERSCLASSGRFRAAAAATCSPRSCSLPVRVRSCSPIARRRATPPRCCRRSIGYPCSCAAASASHSSRRARTRHSSR
jgi:DNA-binding SARP family transcriptional activator